MFGLDEALCLGDRGCCRCIDGQIIVCRASTVLLIPSPMPIVQGVRA